MLQSKLSRQYIPVYLAYSRLHGETAQVSEERN
uniref:Uncharacterized protein n=1 Tax=Trichinella nativa TaxID=6335 RepID=A0A0V1KIA9_9BILA